MSPIQITEHTVISRAARCALPFGSGATFESVFHPVLFDCYGVARHRVFSAIGIYELDGDARRRILPEVYGILARRMRRMAEAYGENIATNVALEVVGDV